MAIEIIMPKFGFTQEEAEIVQWIVKEGEFVEKGDPICEVTTDKVNMEVEAPEDGILGGLIYEEGEVVPVTVVIGYILEEGEEAPPPPAEKPTVQQADTEEEETAAPAAKAPDAPAASASGVNATPVARRMAEVEGVDLSVIAANGEKVTRQDVERYLATQRNGGTAEPGGKVRATPAARRVAREHGLDLAAIPGSGPRGRVQEDDALAAAESGQAAPARTAAPAPAPLPMSTGEPVVVPLEGMRKTIATRLTASYQEAPHIMFTVTADMTESIRLRQMANDARSEDQVKVSMTAVIMKAVAWALTQVPQFNAHFRDDQIIMLPDVHIGMAVALEDGLIVPVIQHVEKKGLVEVGQEVADKATRARTGKLRGEDLIEGTFSISNMGMYGIDHFTSIINPPQVGILAVGKTERQFVPGENDEPVVRPLMKMTLSADHRVIDGAVAGTFIAAIRDALEDPARMML